VLVGGIWELLNNFLIHFNPGNFIFAVCFYIVALSIAYLFFKIFFKKKFPKYIFAYVVIMGVWVGLLFNEWLLVWNTPYNPNADALISQISMVSFHASLYTLPVLILMKVEWAGKLLKWFMKWMVFVIVIAIILRIAWQHAFVLPWWILMTYFIGYNILFIKVIQRVRKIQR